MHMFIHKPKSCHFILYFLSLLTVGVASLCLNTSCHKRSGPRSMRWNHGETRRTTTRPNQAWECRWRSWRSKSMLRMAMEPRRGPRKTRSSSRWALTDLRWSLWDQAWGLMGLVCVGGLGLLEFDGFDFWWVCVLKLSMKEGISVYGGLICVLKWVCVLKFSFDSGLWVRLDVEAYILKCWRVGEGGVWWRWRVGECGVIIGSRIGELGGWGEERKREYFGSRSKKGGRESILGEIVADFFVELWLILGMKSWTGDGFVVCDGWELLCWLCWFAVDEI